MQPAGSPLLLQTRVCRGTAHGRRPPKPRHDLATCFPPRMVMQTLCTQPASAAHGWREVSGAHGTCTRPQAGHGKVQALLPRDTGAPDDLAVTSALSAEPGTKSIPGTTGTGVHTIWGVDTPAKPEEQLGSGAPAASPMNMGAAARMSTSCS